MAEIAGLERKTLPTGARYLKLRHSADPEKDDRWLATVEREMADTPSVFRLQILMEDRQSANALWQRDWFDREGFRRAAISRRDDRGLVVMPKDIAMVVVALDPAVTDPGLKNNRDKQPDETGIVVAGITEASELVLIADFSGVMAPEDWAQLTVKAAHLFQANSVIYEANQGGDLVRLTLTNYGLRGAIHAVHASKGKRPRAEPVSTIYAQGRAQHAGRFSALESELCTWDSKDPSAPSPGRLDALVWAAHGLNLCDATTGKVTKRSTRKEYPQ